MWLWCYHPFFVHRHFMITRLLLSFVLTSLFWRFSVKPSLDAFIKNRNVPEAKDSMRGIIGFARPHTVKGTILATISGYILLSIYHESQAYIALIVILISGVLANIFIVGINQLVDVDIDITNKKNLPLVTKELTWITGRKITGRAFVLSITVAFFQSVLWGSTIMFMCLIGIVYSVPPLRLKRFAVPAALCIVSARALLATIGGVYAYSHAMGKSVDEYMQFHLIVFTGILIAFTTVIALMKDVPDIEGDEKEGVRSFSITLGPAAVLRICFYILSMMYVTVIALMWQNNVSTVFTHLYALIWLHAASVPGSSKSIAMHNYFNVIWPLFYCEFFAYLGPIALQHTGLDAHIPQHFFAFVLGIESAYLSLGRVTKHGIAPASSHLLAGIAEKSGLDVSSLHRNLGLKGPLPIFPANDIHIAEAAVQMGIALNMHAKLTKLTGKAYKDAKKLAILCGDWLLARSVMALCETKNQSAIHEMGKSIMSATQKNENEISNTVIEFACRADRLVRN